ncbi:MAG: cytochrome c maturation protein CcmE [Deltaproteobacteria bacterium]
MEKSTLYKVLLTIFVVLGGGGFLIYSSIGHAQHYRMVDELIGDGFTGWTDKELKVHGFVEAGTIVETVVGQVQHRTFVLQKNGKKIRIFNEGPKPDTFKDQSEVVATGRLVKASEVQALATQMCDVKNHPAPVGCPLRTDAEQEWVLESSELMAKCPSKYDGAPTTKIDTTFKP